MLKLYRFTGDSKQYWETWDQGEGVHVAHWGELGTNGHSSKFSGQDAEHKIQQEVDARLEEGYHLVALDDHYHLVIAYAVDGMGSEADVAKRHRLEDKLNETLGWAGLGHCEGGSIGSGSMEVCAFVVDFDLARAAIERDLLGTEFENYIRIYDEDAE